MPDANAPAAKSKTINRSFTMFPPDYGIREGNFTPDTLLCQQLFTIESYRKMNKQTYRIGQIVPSSNTTMETEIPAMLRAREAVEPERFTFHSSRMRMKKVTKEELEAMDADSGRCAVELVDARVDVLGYACLVAIMSMGKGYHCQSESKLHDITAKEGHPVPVVTSAGALIAGLKALNAKKVSLVAPYLKPLDRKSVV